MKNKNNYQLLIVFVILLLFAISLESSSAATANVNDGAIGGGIKQGLVDAGPGGNIILATGNYTGVNNTNLAISHNVTIRGDGSADNVIIDAKGLSRIFVLENNINVTFINITFQNAKFAGNGGAIYNNYTGTIMTFINCRFINNIATNASRSDTLGNGGAIYNLGNHLTVTNSTFTNNNVSRDGGAIYNKGSNVAITNSTFTNNSANREAATICNEYGDYFTVTNSTFTNNTVKAWGGGGIYNSYGNHFTVTNSTFTNNTGDEGGAIRNEYGNHFTVTNSTFTNNYAKWFGGAIYNHNADNFTITKSTFTNNTAGYYAGAIYNILSDNFTITNSKFVKNIALDNNDIPSISGAIYNDKSNHFTITNSNFTDNSANWGGAIYNYYSDYFTITNSKFTNNTANDGSGGAIYNDYSDYFTVTNSTFTNNKVLTGDGGAICNEGSFTVVTKSTFTNNTAINGKGGAICNYENMFVSGNIMTDNKANLGQMIYNYGNIGGLRLIYMDNRTVNVSGGVLITVYVILTDDMGNTVTGQDIEFIIDGISRANETSIEGKASISYLTPDEIGKIIPVTGNYKGHDGYDIKVFNGQLRIPIYTKTTIVVPPTVKIPALAKKGKTFNVTGILTDEKGNRVVNVYINVIVDGKTYTVLTDAVGRWTVSYTPTHVGTIAVTAKFAGDNKYNPCENSTVFSVTKGKVFIKISIKDNPDGSVTITANVTDDEGKSVINYPADFYVDGKQIGHKDTDVKGVASIKIPGDGKEHEYSVHIPEAEIDASSENNLIHKTKLPLKNTELPLKNKTAENNSGIDNPKDEKTNITIPSAGAYMKNTGMPIIFMLLVLLSSLGLITREKNKKF